VSATTSTSGEPVTILSVSECWDLLASVALGRVVTSGQGQPEIFPVKLVSAAINNRVLFEADDHDVAEGWSVIVKGTAHMLHTDEEIEEAERAQLLPWTATLKLHWVRVLPVSVTGRRFRFGPEPDRESTFA
jgi:nitroimidazol reductase NimA-like FMN-containing flavoprotein (pyridoxamine 5'-phosphate oxidase superfamily)